MTKNISTEELAAALCIQPQTIRAGLCRNKGAHYMGLKPIKQKHFSQPEPYFCPAIMSVLRADPKLVPSQ